MGDRGSTSGFIREVELKGGTAFYAQLRLADGRRIQRRLGWAWTKRSRPPAGYLTRAQAEARLERILGGQDESSGSEAGLAGDVRDGRSEWMRYVEHDRKRRPSTVQDYRRELKQRLIPEFGADTPLTEITTERVEQFRERMVMEGTLSARTINKRLQQLHSVFKRAQKVFGLQVNPVVGVERQPFRRSGDIRVLSPSEVALLAANATTRAGRRPVRDRGVQWPPARRAPRSALERRRLDAAAGPRAPLLHAPRGRPDQVRQGALGAAGRPSGAGPRRAEPTRALHRRGGPRLRQRGRGGDRGVGDAAALLRRSEARRPRTTSASTTCATRSGRSRCRRSR